ncbi:MAG: serine/threonine-protein kinase, partial [Gemmatimonadota bacterium]
MSIPRERLEEAFADRFEIERELGQGGMAVVYLAFDLEDNRQVALKVLLPELASSVGGDRFLKEIEIGRRLSHTHILPLYRSGQAGGLLYYTMQFAEGETLRQRMDRERQLPIEDSLDIAREVASALEYAHRQDVVHRDIKPENIMLTEGGAVVMDFGIARALDEAGAERLTKTGLSMGTPAYMSPEQADGNYLDGRADQYSLACVLYELLAGHSPFQGTSTQAILSRHARDPVPPLSSARPTVSIPIETVIAKALSKVPADRFRTAAKFSEALDMAEQGVTPRGVTPFDNRAIRPSASLWEEFKRRRVFKVGAAYGVTAFVVLQGSEALGIILPEELQRWVIYATILGFPVALLLAWWFELTPQGVRRTQFGIPTPATGEQLAPKHRRIMWAAVVGFALVGGYLAISELVVGGGGFTFDLTSVRPIDLEPRDFVVMPFRVTGSE